MRKYFYYDSTGKLKKYIHCIRGCEESYRQEEIGNKIFKANDTTFICHRCTRELRLSLELQTKVIPKKLKSTEKVVQEKENTQIIENIMSEDLSIKNKEQNDVKKEFVEKLINKKHPVSAIEIKEKSAFYVIVVQCSDLTYFVSITSDVNKSIKNHNSGCGSKYTKDRRPVKLIEFKNASSFDEAQHLKQEFYKKYR
jgi:putative endonuclease